MGDASYRRTANRGLHDRDDATVQNRFPTGTKKRLTASSTTYHHTHLTDPSSLKSRLDRMFSALRSVAAPRAFARSFSSTPASQVARMNLVGRLGTAPEEVQVSGERTLVRYVIGTNYGRGEEKKTSWFRVASFVQGPQKDYLMNVPKG